MFTGNFIQTQMLVYFVYGLAFFIMGVALFLEAGRVPLLAEARSLRPLAIFGLVHGIHEWLEMFLLQAHWLGLVIPISYGYLLLGVLVFSFISLAMFGVHILRLPRAFEARDIIVGLSLLGVYTGSIYILGFHPWSGDVSWLVNAATLGRYLMAVPAALLAAYALRHHAQHVDIEARKALEHSLRFAGFGFAIYSLTQLVATPSDFFIARYLNTSWFVQSFGVPIQAVRAFLGIVITIGMIRATQLIDKERQRRLIVAQDQRLEALQQLQLETERREKLQLEHLRHTVNTQEEERARISRELHDETAQTLAAFSANLGALRNRVSGDAEQFRLIDQLGRLSDDMALNLRRMVHDLRPAQLDDLGLASALHFLAEVMEKDLGLKVELEIHGNAERQDKFVETVLYRVTQEALTNVAKHAKTGRAEVELHFEADHISLVIKDEGCGFDESKISSSPKVWGLAGIRERIESVEGVFVLQTAPERGTIIRAHIPCNSQS